MKKYKMFILDYCKTVYVYQDNKNNVLQTMVNRGLIASIGADVKCLDVQTEIYNAEKFNTIEVQQ